MTRLQITKVTKALFSFTKSESRGILLLMPMLIVIGLILLLINRPHIEKSFPMLADLMLDSADMVTHGRTKFGSEGHVKSKDQDDTRIQHELFIFDPNTIDYRGLRKLGFTQQSAAALINYRTKYSKVFELPTDFAACFQVTDSIFDRLEPYIIIGERYRTKVTGADGSKNMTGETTVTGTMRTTNAPHITSGGLFRFDPNTLDSAGFRQLGFSARQTQVIINYRVMKDGFRSIEEFGECYCVTNRIDQLRPYIVMVPLELKKVANVAKVEINGADLASLSKVKGIGSLTAGRIIEYREMLGGFYDVGQLSEVAGVLEKNFELFSKEIYVDSSVITKIDINFAPAQIMNSHPYMSGMVVRKVLKYKQLKGGLRSIEEMINDKILSKEEADKLSHYLIFTPFMHQ